MRKIFLILILTSFSFISCKKEHSDGWVKSITDGKYFDMANTIRLYFIDDKNDGIIDPDHIETFPYAYRNGIKPSEISVPDDYTGGLYNGNYNSIVYDADKKLYYGTTYIQGDKSKHSYTFYLSCAGEIYQFDAQYSYKPGGAVGGGDGVGIRLDQLKINGVAVANNNNMYERKVIIKKSNGKTSISVE